MSLREYEMVMKAVADPTRVRILKLLEAGEMCVCQVVAVLELGQSTVSKHLFLMKMAGLVRERQEKKWVHYARAESGGSPYARKMLAMLKSPRPPSTTDHESAGSSACRASVFGHEIAHRLICAGQFHQRLLARE